MKSRGLILAAGLLAGCGGVAIAQTMGAFDAGQLPATKGKVAQYSLTPRGDVDGLILDDGTEVHMPPHLGTQLVFTVKPGDAVTIHGLKARAIPMIQAMSIGNDATGKSVVDNGPAGGPHGPHGSGEALKADGHVKEQLHGPRGDLNGVLLDDGTIVRLPPPEAERLAAQLAPGAALHVEGVGIAGPLGRVIEARSIGPNAGQMAQIAAPHPHGHRPPGGPDAPPSPSNGADGGTGRAVPPPNGAPRP